MASDGIRRASLAELRERALRGKIRRGEPATEDDLLPDAFWEAAEVVARPKTSVHLELDPEVFDFFKRQGKGHLTRMQAVLAAYARTRDARPKARE